MTELILCPDCGVPMVLIERTTDGQKSFKCVDGCGRGRHKAHPNGEPTGRPGTHEERKARAKAHEAFDRLWNGDAVRSLYPRVESGRSEKFLRNMHRGRCYVWLAAKLNIPVDDCHIGRFGVIECEAVLIVCEGVTPLDVRKWAKARKVALLGTQEPNRP